MIYPDADATGLSAFAEGNAVIKSLKIWDLNRK
jgi:levanase/fructan beta-fructosidase